MSLVGLCDSIPAETDAHDRRDQNHEPDSRTSSNHASHISLQKEQLNAYWLDHIGYFGPP